MKFVASRLSEGNKIFPAEIHIEENGIKVKIPGFLSGDTRFINYEHITSVDISTPMIGFSSITFYNQGNKAFAHGFKKEEVKQIKEAIDRGKANAKVTTVNHNHNYANPANQQELQQQPVIQRVVESQPIPIVIPTHSTNNTQPVAKENDGMYSEQIEKLIAFALSDGELTEKEKQILFKKAEEAGIDLDEFEMVLDAKLHEMQQSTKQPIAPTTPAPPTAAPKSDKLGDVKKCPACGARVGAFKGICSDCGHEFSNIEATNSSQKLYQELIRVEEDERNRPIEKSGMPSIHSLFSGANDHQAEMKLNGRIYKRKIGVVSMFPIPNTKADILEFLSLAVSEGGKKIGGLFSPMSLEEREYIKAWRAKADQVVVKARFSLKDDKKLVEEINTYAKQLEIK